MKANNKLRIVFSVSVVGSILCSLVLILFQSMKSAINIPTFHLDGAFQTASGLFRLQSGQAPGRDFFPYLGIGPLLLIFPFFKMAGGTLCSSVFAAKFVTLALGWFSVSVLWHFVFRPRTGSLSCVGGAAVFFATNLVTRQIPCTKNFSFLLSPGNSLRPIRAAIPYIVAIALYIILRCNKMLRRNILAGVLLGISLLWSNDFAIPTACIFLFAIFSFFYFKENSTWIKSAITICMATVLSWAVLLFLFTCGHPLELIRYNFIDVLADQWWFFAPYGPSTRIFKMSQFFRLFTNDTFFPLGVLLATSFFAFKTKKIEHTLVALIGVTLFLGGSLASVGGHLAGYFEAFFCWSLATTVLAGLRGIQLLTGQTTEDSGENPHKQILYILGVFFILFASANSEGIRYQKKISAAKKDQCRYFVPELGGYIGIEWKDYIDYARRHKGSNVVEEYWGVWSSLSKSFAPWPVDSTIHALGDVRRVAKSTLPDANLIITTRYTASPEWQPWCLSQNFWFYEALFSNWVPDFISPTTVVWRKDGKPRKYQDIKCHVSDSGNSFTIDSNEIGFYKVTLNYITSGAGRFLLMVKNNISFAADASGYVSIPPNASTATIPALITKDSGNVFDTKVVGGDGVNFKIISCSVKKIPYSNPEILHFAEEN